MLTKGEGEEKEALSTWPFSILSNVFIFPLPILTSSRYVYPISVREMLNIFEEGTSVTLGKCTLRANSAAAGLWPANDKIVAF